MRTKSVSLSLSHSLTLSRAHYLGQISEVAGQSEVKFRRVVVGDNPGEDRVLVQVIIGPTWWGGKRKWEKTQQQRLYTSREQGQHGNKDQQQEKLNMISGRLLLAGLSHNLPVLGGVLTRDGVEKDEVIEVGYLAALPALGHVGRLE